jgi:dihydroneopterin aldolase
MSDIGRSERRMREEHRAQSRAGRIEIRGLEVFAHHGVFESEREHGQLFRLDVTLDVDTHIAAQSDRLSDAIDYAQVVQDVAAYVRSTRYDLLEALASNIVDELLRNWRVAAAEVRITKPDVKLSEPVQEVAVTIRRAQPIHLS